MIKAEKCPRYKEELHGQNNEHVGYAAACVHESRVEVLMQLTPYPSDRARRQHAECLLLGCSNIGQNANVLHGRKRQRSRQLGDEANARPETEVRDQRRA